MLDQYRRNFAEFNIACALEHYVFQSGQKNALEIAPIYERYSQLFDRSLVDLFKRELAAASADFETENASVSRFFAFAVEQYLEDSVKRLTEEIGQFEAAATVEWTDGEMTFQDATVAITTECDRQSRQTIYSRRLAVIEQSFYSASYLRAWAFEVSLREYLKTRFGSHWWASRRTGDFLKEIWETGDRYTADEMAAQIGIGPIRFDPLIDEFNAALK